MGNYFSELIEYLDEKFEGINKSFKAVDKRFETIEGNIAKLPTKTDLDDKLADLSGDLIVKLRKEDQKLNRLLEMMKQKNLLTESELQELARFQIFPKQT